MAVHEVNPKVGSSHCLSHESLDGALHQPRCLWERYPIELGFHWRRGVIPLCPPANHVLVLVVRRQ